MTHRFGAPLYLIVTFTWSAVFWLLSPVLFAGTPPASSPVFLIGGAGPLIIALLFTLREAPAIRSDFWQRLLDPRRIQGGWWAAVLLLHPALILVACVLAGWIDGQGIQGSRSFHEMTQNTATAGLFALTSSAFFTFWFGPLPEEVGWRGFLQERISGRFGWVVGSLFLGVAWAVWHLPLFFVPGTFQHDLGIGHLRFWVFMAAMIPLSVIMGWIWIRTRRSTLGAAWVHWSGNFASLWLMKSALAATIELLLLTTVAVLVTRFGYRASA